MGPRLADFRDQRGMACPGQQGHRMVEIRIAGRAVADARSAVDLAARGQADRLALPQVDAALQHGPVNHGGSVIAPVEHDPERVGGRLAKQPQTPRPDPQLNHRRLARREVEDGRPHGYPELPVRIVDPDAGLQSLVPGVHHGEPVLANSPTFRGPRDQLELDGVEQRKVRLASTRPTSSGSARWTNLRGSRQLGCRSPRRATSPARW
jgi:hypothetical protein